MATIGANPQLAVVRRLEALGFRAWPATSAVYDGSWQVRLTEGHPAKRLNSINPLDPSDYRDIAARIDALRDRFLAGGRPLIFRLTPLAAPQLETHFDDHGWERFDESVVMLADIRNLTVEAPDAVDMIDLDRYVDAAKRVHGYGPAVRSGLEDVLASIRPETGFFVHVIPGMGPVASTMCVHDNDMAGLLELATRADSRRRGFARGLVGAALQWVRSRGASKVWLQVGADNGAAIALYRAFGFRDVYRYHYRRDPAGGAG